MVKEKVISNVNVEIEKPKKLNFLKNKRPFLFTDEQIATMPEHIRNVVLMKKAWWEDKRLAPVPKGKPLLIWKIKEATTRYITTPYKVKPLGHLGGFCRLCGSILIEGAHVAWEEEHYNKETDNLEHRHFVVGLMCCKCMNEFGVSSLMEAEWYDVLISGAENVRFVSIGDAKAYACEFCSDHSTDSTWISVPYQGKIVSAAVCEKHFNMIAGTDCVKLSSYDIADKLSREGLLSKEVMDKMKYFRRKSNKDGGQ